MRVQDIVDILDNAFHFSTQDSWDNSGLLIGNPDYTATGILLALDITESVVNEAINKGLNVIVAHHPIMFRGLKRLVSADPEQRLIAKAIRSDISIIAVHTPLDKTPHIGTSYAIGKLLSLQNMQTLCPEKLPYDNWGYGAVGQLPQAMPADKFLSFVANTLHCETISHNGNIRNTIQKVAICTGSSVEFTSKAEASGADAYITADIKYHQMASSESMLLMDIGHFESEIISTSIFLHLFQEKIPNFALCISDASENIIKYYINTDGK